MTTKNTILHILGTYNICTQKEIDTAFSLALTEKKAIEYIVENFLRSEGNTTVIKNRPYQKILKELSDTLTLRDNRFKDQIFSKLDKKYELIYVDYRDDLLNNLDDIQECIDSNSIDSLHHIVNEMYDNDYYDPTYEIIQSLELTTEEKDWLEDADNTNLLYEEIWSRDNSDPLKDLIRNTGLIPVRITLQSNYDVFNSDYYMSPYTYDGIIKQTIDFLNLNPIKVTEVIQTSGDWPDISERNGNELVSYKDFAQELANNCASSGQFVLVGQLHPYDLYSMEEDKPLQVTIPKGNTCGIFDTSTGSGSLIEMSLLQDVTITLKEPRETEFDYFELSIDDAPMNSYGINSVYGVTSDFYGDQIKLFS